MKARFPLAVLLMSVPLVATAADNRGVTGYDADGAALYLINTQDVMSEVYNGTRSLDGEFPAMGWIGNCTGTLVAPNVLFTAAHCVRTGSRITFQHRESQQDFAATCTRHPRVNTSSWYNDFALCKLDEAVPEDSVLASFKHETPEQNQELLLNGLGAPTVRTHQWGRSTVSRLGTQDIVACGGAVLGGGDSGGSLLEWTEDRTGASGFYILGVNSRSDRRRCSYFNRVNHPDFIGWVEDYESKNDVQICGFSAVCN